MKLLSQYYEKLTAGQINHDPAQEKAIEILQAAAESLMAMPERPVATPKSEGFLKGLFGRKTAPAPQDIPKGVYFWGGVGRGKTWLMDMFFAELPIEKKKRWHFHHCMEIIHKSLKQHPDQEEPLRLIARELAREMRVLCLDELHLTEITNARLLLPLLEFLMREGVMVVTTSNRHPDELYQGKLKGELFIPYTDFLKAHMEVFHLDNGQDYRMKALEKFGGDLPELEVLSNADLEQKFRTLSEGIVAEQTEFTINHRPVPIKKAADNVVWLDFAVACEGNRTTSDYIWLCDRYDVIILSDVFVMTVDDEPVARRFFNMVDELYDRDIQLYFSSEKPLSELYQGERLQFAFRRTLSRLTAMHFAPPAAADS